MRNFIVLLLTGFFIMNYSVMAEPLITNVDNRQHTSLNGNWQIVIDPYENGYYNYRYLPDENGYFNNAKAKDKTDRVEYNFDAGEELKVPGDWNTQQEKLFLYEGTIWYKKSFDYKLAQGKRLFVYFGAVNYHAIVYLNGEKLGEHEGGFTPFNFEITRLVKEQDNFLIVKVDNKRKREGVPTMNTDWWNYGGITRSVMLLETAETFIQDYFVQLQKGSLNTLQGWVQLNGNSANRQVTISIPEAKLTKTLVTDVQGRAEFQIPAKLTLWSPENPKLYTVQINAETDAITDQIGFRSITTRGTDILLNGKPIFLRGICIHEEAPLRTGRAFSQEDAEILLGWAKELNCNFVRLAHYPHNENMTRVADRLGIMVWSEIPVYWTILWENEQTFANAGNQLTEMITRDKNKASVILWSMANETPVSEPRLEFLGKLANRARELDPTRLITAAMERHYDTDNKTQIIDDPFGEYVDVLGCNEYIGWYDGLPEKCRQIAWKSIYNKPLIFSEFGGGALYGLHGDALTVWSEEYQEDLYRQQTEMFASIPFLKGTTPWILMDFRSPRRPLPHVQDFFNRKGLVSERGEKKKAFYVMQQFYKQVKEKYNQ